MPILDASEDVVLLLHRADDITDYVRYRDDGGSDASGGQQWAERVHQTEADLFSRTQELEQANAELLALSERERHTAQSLAGLATTVSALSAAESRTELLRQMFRHGRRALQADVLAVALLEPGGGHLAVVDTRDEKGSEPIRRLSVHSPAPMAAAAAGKPVFQEDAAHSGADAPLEGLAAWAALPLRIGGRPLGSLTVGWERRHVFEDNDVRVLEAFAAQCSQAVNRVARRETERRQARATRSLVESLQRSFLTDPPQTEHLEIAVRYRPAAREVQIGGDWYDAFLSPTGDTTLVVGDVTGHDWTAAAVAGQLRNMLRGIASALDSRRPEQVLSALDRALSETGIATLATAIIARVEEPPAWSPDRGRVLRWSNAGHLPPLLIAPDGTAACWSDRRTCSSAWTRTRLGSATRSCWSPVRPSSCTPTGWSSVATRHSTTAWTGCSRPPQAWPGGRWTSCATRSSAAWIPTSPTTSRCWLCASARTGRFSPEAAGTGRARRPSGR